MQEYDEISGPDGFTEDQIHPLFINMISTIKELANLRTQESLNAKSKNDSSLKFNYAEYIHLAIEVCDTLDETEAIKNTCRRMNLHILDANNDDVNLVCNAHMNETIPIDDDNVSNGEEDFLQDNHTANKTTFGTPYNGPLLPRSSFTQMSMPGKDAWKSMSAQDCQVIFDTIGSETESQNSSMKSSGSSDSAGFQKLRTPQRSLA